MVLPAYLDMKEVVILQGVGMPVGQWRFISHWVYLAASLEWFVLLSAGILTPRTKHLTLSASGLDTSPCGPLNNESSSGLSSASAAAQRMLPVRGNAEEIPDELQSWLHSARGDLPLSCCNSTCNCSHGSPVPVGPVIDKVLLPDKDGYLNAVVAELLFNELNFSSPHNTLLWKPFSDSDPDDPTISGPYIYSESDSSDADKLPTCRESNWLDQWFFLVAAAVNFTTATALSFFALAFIMSVLVPIVLKGLDDRELYAAASLQLNYGKNQDATNAWEPSIVLAQNPRLGLRVFWRNRPPRKDATQYLVEVRRENLLESREGSLSFYISNKQVRHTSNTPGQTEIFISAQHPADTTLARLLFKVTGSRKRSELEPFHQPLELDSCLQSLLLLAASAS